MNALKGYQIPIVGLADGRYTYKFNVDAAFFDHFENEEMQQHRFEVQIDLDKQLNMFILNFEINGTLDTECDRCLANISLPIQQSYRLIMKMEEGESEDPDVEHIAPDAMHIDVDHSIYEYVLMSLPMVNVYDCENDDPRPCDLDALDALEQSKDSGDSSVWDALKNIDVEK